MKSMQGETLHPMHDWHGHDIAEINGGISINVFLSPSNMIPRS